MTGLALFLISTAIFVALMLVGWYVLDIRPTLAEGLLIGISLGCSQGVSEGLK